MVSNSCEHVPTRFALADDEPMGSQVFGLARSDGRVGQQPSMPTITRL